MSQEPSQSRREPTFDNDIGAPPVPEPVFAELADSIAQAQVDQIQVDAGAAVLGALQAKDDEIAALTAHAAALDEQIAALNAKAAELSDQYLRGQAEVQNARRRADDEVAKARKFALEGFAEHLLPVVDSLEAGLSIKEATAEQIREGAEATLRQLQAALERNKVVAINPEAGAKFDPHQHQAISVVPLTEGSPQGPNTVVGVLQKGYLIAERVLRPALVTVSPPQ